MIASDLSMGLDAVQFAERALDFRPDGWQARALRWGGRRALWCCSRQSGKSTTAAILALHQAMYCPGSLTLLISPSQRQSSELFKRVTTFLGQLDARPELVEDNRLSLTMASGSRVVSLPSSEATIRGFGGVSLLIEDESARVSDDLFRATTPMLATSAGRHVLLSTPHGRRGHFFETWEHGGPGWERVKVTAAECPRIPAAFLEEERRGMGNAWYEQEYECQFHDAEGSVFRQADIMAALSDSVAPLFTGGRP